MTVYVLVHQGFADDDAEVIGVYDNPDLAKSAAQVIVGDDGVVIWGDYDEEFGGYIGSNDVEDLNWYSFDIRKCLVQND